MAKAYNKLPLGRGLSALLNNSVEEINSISDEKSDQIIGRVIELPINQVKVNPFQPRTNFENEKINEKLISNHLKSFLEKEDLGQFNH